MRKHLLLFTAVFVFLHSAYAQDSLRVKPAYLHSGKIGLGLDGITGSPNLLLKYFFNNQFAMQAIVGLDLDVPGGSTPQNYTKVTGMTIRGGCRCSTTSRKTRCHHMSVLRGYISTKRQEGSS